MSLCATCKESFTWTAAQCDLFPPGSKNHHLTHRDWMQAVEQGCNICTLLHDALPSRVAYVFLTPLDRMEEQSLQRTLVMRNVTGVSRKSEIPNWFWNNSDLIRQLAWYSCTTKNPRPHYRAASWSWASVGGTILWRNLPAIITPRSKIIDISTTPSGSDPTGPVTGGHILIQGNIGRVQIVDQKTGLLLRREDNVNEISKRHITIRGFDVSGLQFGLYFILHLSTDTIQPNKIHSSPSEDYRFAKCLVLRPVVGQHGTFERYGLVEEYCPEDGEYRTLTHRGLKGRQDIPCEEYDEHEESYRIRIV